MIRVKADVSNYNKDENGNRTILFRGIETKIKVKSIEFDLKAFQELIDNKEFLESVSSYTIIGDNTLELLQKNLETD